jgi:hypothetical protein
VSSKERAAEEARGELFVSQVVCEKLIISHAGQDRSEKS